MGKVVLWVLILTGLSILCFLAGLPTNSHLLLDAAHIDLNRTGITEGGNVTGLAMQDATQSSWFTLIFTSIAGFAAIGAIVAALYVQKSPVEAILLAITTSLGLWLTADAVSIVNLAFKNSGDFVFIGWIVTLVYIPIVVSMWLGLAQWWRGADVN